MAGAFIAYLEVTFLRATVGPFWAGVPFLLRSLALYIPAGAAAGTAADLFLRLPGLRSRALRMRPRSALLLGFTLTAGLILEILVALMDLQAFRGPGGRWSLTGWEIFIGGAVIAIFSGWLGAKAVRSICGLVGLRRRLYLAALGIGLAAVFYAAGLPAEPQPGRNTPRSSELSRPANVLLVVIDSLRADHLSAYGHVLPTSPSLDRLAREGVLFRDCLAASTWTVPTHASLFTGLYPSSHGSYSLLTEFDSSRPSLPRILGSRGYRTASLYDNPLVGARFGLSDGFQTALGVDNEHKVSLAFDRVWRRILGHRSSTSTILKAAKRWMDGTDRKDRPFFMFLNLLDVHFPYRPRKPTLDEFLKTLPAEKTNPDLIRICTTDAINDRQTAERVFPRLTKADWRVLSRYYDANIRAVDEDLGRFFETLRSEGRLDDTLVIITSDHGELLGEAGGGGHSQTGLKPEVLRVPLILRFPGRIQAGDVARAVSQIDIFPTILRLAGFESDIPPGIQGRDLLASDSGRGILAESWDETREAFDRAWFVGEDKLLVTASGRKELYDRKTDPTESSDLSRENRSLLDRLSRGLEDQLSRMPKARTTLDPKKRKELERRLRSLGYL